MEIAILGLGGVGSAAARFLAGSGHRVVGFEQYALDHDRGSSYGGSRIIRKVYPDPFYVELMEAAYPLWGELEREAGENLFLHCGGFFFGPEGHAEMMATEAALQTVGVPYARWSASETRRRLPFALADDQYGLFEPQSGLLRASRCVRAMARLARSAGAELREQCPVEAVEVRDSGIWIRSAAGEERFDRLLIAAGPWAGRVLAPWLTLPVVVTRQQYAHFALIRDRAAFAPERFPVWIDVETYYYGFPEHDEVPGVKVALHRFGPEHDPAGADREPRDEDDAAAREYLRRRLPAAAGEVTLHKVCLYTVTPDQDFLVDRVPGEPRIAYIGGLSGHGFKFTVLLGRIGARLVTDQEPGHDLTRFSLARFGN
ncbi:MAG: N-methyl-L-tryptophan oxidase [Armatimonadetes bacterium]|nr:N-methyl-L-tryptophan oxidase [Armatimonadota bacterium]